MTIVYLLGGIGALLLMRVPVAFALLMPCLAYIQIEPHLTAGIALQRVASLLNSFPLLAVPLFIMVGYVANVAGMADRLIRALLAVMGQVRGALAYVNVNASLVFSWMSGSSMADAAAMGSVMIPAMRKNGYSPSFAAAITAASSTIGPVMPPSIGAVLYAVLSHTSIAAMFLAGVLPALAIFAMLTVYVFFYVRRNPPPKLPRQSFPEIRRSLTNAIPILLAPVLLLGGILGGVFTPTEAAGVTVVYMVVASAVLGWMDVKGLYRALVQTATTTGQVMLIAAVGGLFSYILAREGIPLQIAGAMQALTDNPLVFLLLINFFLLVIGMILEPASALLITVPVLFPIATQYGIDPLHLGIIVIFNLTLGLLTPPIGLVLYMLGSVGGLSFREVLMATLPLLIPLFVALAIITYVPALSLSIPNFFGYR